MSEALKKLDSLLTEQPQNPLRPNQLKDYTEEAERLRAVSTAPSYISADRGAATKQYNRLNKLLAEQAPKPVKDKDAVAKLAAEVMEHDIRPAMLTYEEMRRNPAGSVGRFMRQENSKPVKRAISTWKRAQFALEPETEDPDHANVERFRPEKALTGASTFMAEAQIPGNFAMTPQAKANWPLGEPTIETPLKTARAREWTPEQKAEASKKYWARRQQKSEGVTEGHSPSDIPTG